MPSDIFKEDRFRILTSMHTTTGFKRKLMDDYIPLEEGQSIFDLKFPLEDVMAAREHMIESGQIKQLETPYGLLDLHIHSLFKDKYVRFI